MSRYYFLRNFKFARKIMGGIWVKTKFRGWISYETYIAYLTYDFDPEMILIEDNKYTKKNKI